MKLWESVKKFFTPSKGKQKEKTVEKKPITVQPPKVVDAKPVAPVVKPAPVKPAPVVEVPKVVAPPVESEGYIFVDLNLEFLAETKKWVGVREKGKNKGKDVEAFQKAVDGKAQGEAWCMSFMQFCVKQVETKYKVKSRIYRSEGCTDCYEKSPSDLKHKTPIIGSIVIWNYKGSWKGHTGAIRKFDNDRIFTVEGNTGQGEGIIREGDGVYERNRCRWGEGNMEIKGYILPFPAGLQKIKKV